MFVVETLHAAFLWAGAVMNAGRVVLLVGGLMIYLSLHNRKKHEKKTSAATA